MDEVWKSMEILANYEISSYGQIRNSKTRRILTSHKQSDGYVRIRIHNNKIKIKEKILTYALVHLLQNSVLIP
jgi:hypothetical protein